MESINKKKKVTEKYDFLFNYVEVMKSMFIVFPVTFYVLFNIQILPYELNKNSTYKFLYSIYKQILPSLFYQKEILKMMPYIYQIIFLVFIIYSLNWLIKNFENLNITWFISSLVSVILYILFLWLLLINTTINSDHFLKFFYTTLVIIFYCLSLFVTQKITRIINIDEVIRYRKTKYLVGVIIIIFLVYNDPSESFDSLELISLIEGAYFISKILYQMKKMKQNS